MSDFETTTKPDDCRVWGWGLCRVQDTREDQVEIGNNIDTFLDRIQKHNYTVYFHNLGFDGSFIMDAIFRDGFRHVQSKHLKPGEFTTLISNLGQFYSMTVKWRNGKTTEFRDSLKKLPMTAARVAESFKLPVVKGDIDYHAERPVGHVPTPEERKYIANDVLIIAGALKLQFEQGMTRLTVGSDALNEYKRMAGKPIFTRKFPILPESMDTEIRQAYRGGFTYADSRFKGRRVGRAGKVYDVNSLYPSVMYDRVLPYGEPMYAEGLPAATEEYPLFIVSLTFTAKLKPNHIPCIQVKGSSHFLATEYQTHIKEPVTIACTNVDLALWLDHYDMDIHAYNGGWLFHGVTGQFTEYIDKWMDVKNNATGGMREIAKLHLNSLYGKFATNPNVTQKIPRFVDNVVKLGMGEDETREPVYTAMGVFITAYARDVTIRAAQDHYDVFAYADTDSLHLFVDEHPESLDVDKNKLGAWKHEYDFTDAIFIRAKAYIEHKTEEFAYDKDGNYRPYVTHVAGLPEKVAKQMTFDDIVNGKVFTGKLAPKRVPGGIVLEDIDFTLTV